MSTLPKLERAILRNLNKGHDISLSIVWSFIREYFVDVKSLFTKVPVSDTVAIIQDLSSRDHTSQNFAVLIEKCRISTYLLF